MALAVAAGTTVAVAAATTAGELCGIEGPPDAPDAPAVVAAAFISSNVKLVRRDPDGFAPTVLGACGAPATRRAPGPGASMGGGFFALTFSEDRDRGRPKGRATALSLSAMVTETDVEAQRVRVRSAACVRSATPAPPMWAGDATWDWREAGTAGFGRGGGALRVPARWMPWGSLASTLGACAAPLRQ